MSNNESASTLYIQPIQVMFLSTEHSMRYLHLRKFTSDKERICPNTLKFNLKHDLSSV